MDCYKLIIDNEDTYDSKSSYGVLIKVIREIFGDATNDEIGFMYIETDTFPKEYYFNTTNTDVLNAFKRSYRVEQADYLLNLTEDAGRFSYIGNVNFFLPKI